MLNKHRLVMLSLATLALALTFTAGFAANSNTCDPSDCKVICMPGCTEPCPPECVVLCKEICASPGVSCSSMAEFDITGCWTKGGASSVLDVTGRSHISLAAGQSGQIVK